LPAGKVSWEVNDFKPITGRSCVWWEIALCFQDGTPFSERMNAMSLHGEKRWKGERGKDVPFNHFYKPKTIHEG
jgi:hypothetical protein